MSHLLAAWIQVLNSWILRRADSDLMTKDDRCRRGVKVPVIKVPPLRIQDDEPGVKHGPLQAVEVPFDLGIVSLVEIVSGGTTLVVISRHRLLSTLQIHHGYIHGGA